MNKNNLNQIFQHYMDQFETINNLVHAEFNKWNACKKFPGLMKNALASSDEEFAKALYAVKKCSYNIIDNYTQPMAGLVELAKREPATVRNILKKLYVDDEGDLQRQMKIIEEFFLEYNALLEKYFPDSFLYKQNSHSVSALLFLNDPEHHYMYKHDQSLRFADCVEFYDSWGNGDNIKLDVYYRMCDELVAEISKSADLLSVNERRFNGGVPISGDKLHPDINKHILAFDLIYCCSVYKLFDGISYTKRNAKEKQVYLSEKSKAESLKDSYNKAKEEMDLLDEAKKTIVSLIVPGDELTHKKYGAGKVLSVDEDYIVLAFPEKEARLGLAVALSNGMLRSDKLDLIDVLQKYGDVLKRYDSIPRTLDYAVRALEPYEEYLE